MLMEADNVPRGAKLHRRDAQLYRCIFEEANKREIENNWLPNMEKVPIKDFKRNANIIGSHFLNKIKIKN